MRTRHAAGLAMLAVTLACGDGGSSPNRNQFVGTWDATKLEFTNKANTSQKVDVIALGATFVAVLDSNGTYETELDIPGQSPDIATGTWSASSDVLTFRESATSTMQFTWKLSGGTLTLSNADTGFDFNGDNVEEDAKLGGVFVLR